jgi:hypothetical protein
VIEPVRLKSHYSFLIREAAMGYDVGQVNSANNTSPPDHSADEEAAAAAAAAARAAAQPLDPQARAAEGFRIASGTPAANASLQDAAVANAGENARTAMARTDLPPETQKQVNVALERLGNAVVDGKIDPNMNNAFKQQLYNLATAHPNDPATMGDFREALAHLTRTAQVSDNVPLAKNTMIAFDANAGGTTGKTNLPSLDVPKLDADIYYKTRDGATVVESSKYSTNTMADKVKDQVEGKTQQLSRQAEWEQKGTATDPRRAGFFMLGEGNRFDALMDKKNVAQLEQTIANHDARNIIIGERAYSLNELKTLDAKGTALAADHVNALKAEHVAAGNTEKSFKTGQAYGNFFKETMATPEAAMKAYGLEVGEPSPQLKPGKTPDIGNVRQGATMGAAGAGIVSVIQLGMKGGNITLQDVQNAATETGKGAVVGAVSAKAEQYVIPAVERKIGDAIQTRAAQVAEQKVAGAVLSKSLGTAAADTTATAMAAKTIGSRIVGSTAVGTVVTTAMSAYENREGLAKGDSKAIGNVGADTAVAVVAVGASTVLGAAASGALAGSVVPGLGTAIGFGVGLAVGVGITVAANASGIRDSIASGIGGAVDWAKSWW